MNQDFNTKLIHNFCSRCGCEGPRFLHRVWYKRRVRRFCTSCALRSHKKSLCPSCLTLYDLTVPPNTICCYKCHSYTHATCFPSNSNPSRESLLCAFCRNPNRLNFTLRKVKARGNDYILMDKNAAELYLRAANIAAFSMNKQAEASKSSVFTMAEETHIVKIKAKGAVNRLLEPEGRESEAHSSDEAMDIDLNEEYPSLNDDI